MHIREGYKPLFHSSDGDIVDEKREIYAKGIFITDELKGKLIFGYDLPAPPNRDRNVIQQSVLLSKISSVLYSLDDPEQIKKILLSLEKGIDYLEYEAMTSYRGVKNREQWKNAFVELFSEDAVISSGNKTTDSAAKILGKDVISAPQRMINFLSNCGVPTARSAFADNVDQELLFSSENTTDKTKTRIAKTSVTLDYRHDKWDARRIVLDALANHMPSDSGGSSVNVEIYVGGNWQPLPKRGDLEKYDIQAIRFGDDGKGFVSTLLELLYSTKKGNDRVVGQFGEGLKMYSAAFLRYKSRNYCDNMRLKMRSRDWAAVPFSIPVDIDGEKAGALAFGILEGLEKQKGSTTTIFRPNYEIRDVISELPKLVLPFNPDYKPLSQTETASIFDGSKYKDGREIENGSVFVKGFFVTTEHASDLLFSYDINTDDIHPDRDSIDSNVVKTSIAKAVANCDEESVIERILKAGKDRHQLLFEFQTIEFTDQNRHVAEAYKKAFHEVYGEKAVLGTDQPFIFAEAVHKGFEPINLNQDLRKTLQNAGIMTDNDIAQERNKWEEVDYEKLTPSERARLEKCRDINRAMGFKDTGLPIVYSRAWRKNGEEADNPAFYSPEKGKVYIRRGELSAPLVKFVVDYVHEKNHEKTGARDPEDKFRESFEDPLAERVTAEIEDSPRVVTVYQPEEAVEKIKSQEKRIYELEEHVRRLQKPSIFKRAFGYLGFGRRE